MNIECYPRVLVVSNNSFSLSNSNGRTLGLLFKDWPKDKLCQFCITSDGPDWDVCNDYFCVSDKQVLKSTLTLIPVKRNDLTLYKTSRNQETKRIKRTSIKSLVRHLIWNLGIWGVRDFKRWVKGFCPEIVVIQSGDTAFTHDLARKISIKYHAKLVFFNTEGIYFLEKNYLYKGFLDSLFFPLYKMIYRQSYRKAMKRASYAFYLNEFIQKDNYLFKVPSTVIYNTTNILEKGKFIINIKQPVVSYFGNMGFDRSKVLVEVAALLRETNNNIIFNVYGKGFSDAIQRLKECPNINYYGFLPYSQIQSVIRESDILLHVESQDPKYSESLKYAFSTKIADCLGSNRPFLLYSSRKIACAQYLIENDCAWFSDNPNSFKEMVESILYDEKVRIRKLNNALRIVEKNHSSKVNSVIFQKKLIALNIS